MLAWGHYLANIQLITLLIIFKRFTSGVMIFKWLLAINYKHCSYKHVYH